MIRRIELPSCEATILEIVPALPSWQSTQESGWPRLTWLKALKKSARNCRLTDSLMGIDLAMARSASMKPGPISELRPRLPKVPNAGRANAPKLVGQGDGTQVLPPSGYGAGVKN